MYSLKLHRYMALMLYYHLLIYGDTLIFSARAAYWGMSLLDFDFPCRAACWGVSLLDFVFPLTCLCASLLDFDFPLTCSWPQPSIRRVAENLKFDSEQGSQTTATASKADSRPASPHTERRS